MDFVDRIENDLREVERELEEIGKEICDLKGSSPTHMAINEAIVKVQDAIHSTFTMRS